MMIFKFFDYIYFRLYKFFTSRGDIVAGTTAALVIALMQFLTVLDIIAMSSVFFNLPMPDSKYYFLPILILFGLLNWYRYERKIDLEDLNEKWDDEMKSKKNLKGWLIILFFLVVSVFPFYYAMNGGDI